MLLLTALQRDDKSAQQWSKKTQCSAMQDLSSA